MSPPAPSVRPRVDGLNMLDFWDSERAMLSAKHGSMMGERRRTYFVDRRSSSDKQSVDW